MCKQGSRKHIFHSQLLTWITCIYDFEVKWVLDLRSIGEGSEVPRHNVAHILLNQLRMLLWRPEGVLEQTDTPWMIFNVTHIAK